MADDKKKLEEKVDKLNEDRAGAEEEIQQLVGKEQLRTGLDPSHEKIRDDKDLPTPDPDKLPPEDGGNQTDPKKIEDNKEAFTDDKVGIDKSSIKEAKEDAKDGEK